MSDAPAGKPADRLAGLSPAKRALLEQRLARAAGAAGAAALGAAPAVAGAGPAAPTRAERVAVIAAACRLPGGADTPEAFWRMLLEGRDAVTEVPAERWEARALTVADPFAPHRMVSPRGAFLDAVDGFDAGFFGISPREAAAMDPQQRLLLEVAWEALEAGGQAVDQLAGSATGVFVGAHGHSSDYWLMQLAQPGGLESHSATGSAHSILANRVSYAFDLRGPSMTVDTACSSSLVAVHLACQSLRSGECDLALAGGTNLMLGPGASLAFSKLQILSPDGRCRTFDARADGIARGEGVALVALKRLGDALRDGDPVLAVIAGSAVNQDGASNGLTAPSGPAQEAVVRRALAMAGIGPERYGCIETHGTGTPLGDPVEVEALANVVGAPRGTDHRCWLGAVKTNIGHLEAAAGVAGLLKAVFCVREGLVPPNLHFTTANPHLRLQGTPFELPREVVPWPAPALPRVAGVSSFGFGGTNAHVVIEEWRAPPHPAPAQAPELATATTRAPEADAAVAADADAAATAAAQWLPVSARDRQALVAAARAMCEALRALPPQELADFAHTARQRRSHHAWRLAVHGSTPAELAARLQPRMDAVANGSEPLRPVVGAASRAVWVYTGQGGLWAGMGRELHAASPAFRAALAEVATAFERQAGWDLRPAVLRDDAQARLAATEVAQPALFALQVALTAHWRSLGVVPGAIVGHSVGEVAAAHAAGVLPLADAVRVIHERSRAMRPTAGLGRMAQVECAEADLRGELDAAAGALSVAALNGPRSTVIAGPGAVLQACLDRLAAQGVGTRMLAVDHAFHSAQMQPCAAAVEAALRGLQPRPAVVPLMSTVHARWAECGAPDGDCGAAYWGRNVREPVLFAPAVARLLDAGFSHFLEIGPHPALGVAILATADAQARAPAADDGGGDAGEQGPAPAVTVAASLRRAQPGTASVLANLCSLYESGAAIDWAALRDPARRVLALPAYPWQRQRHWLGPPDAAALLLGATGRVLSPADRGLQGAAGYTMAWHPAPAPRAALRLQLDRLPALLEAAAAQWPQARQLAQEAAEQAGLERRGAALAWQALRGLGVAARAGTAVTPDDAGSYGVQARHARLWTRLLEMCADAGFLEVDPSAGPVRRGAGETAAAWRVTPRGEASFPLERLETLEPRRTEAALMERCGQALASVLRGQTDPLALLFPADGSPSAAEVYQGTPSAQLYNRLAAEAVAQLAAQSGRPLRVLEIGAGTGATTARLLPSLPAGGEYCFTDVSPMFLHEGRERFGAHGAQRSGAQARRFDFRRLDIEAPPEAQGFEPGGYDLVVAANVLHATADLARTLAHVRRLLAPGGVLLLLETVARRAWADLTFGLTEGWWRYADAPLRTGQALLDPAAWSTLLRAGGFDAVHEIGASLSATAVHAQALVLARASTGEDATPRLAGTAWHLVADAGGRFAAALAAALRAAGAACSVSAPEDAPDAPQDAEPGATPGEGTQPLSAKPPLHGVIHCGALVAARADALTPGGIDRELALGAGSALAWARHLAGRASAWPTGGPTPPPRLWLLTRGAQAVVAGDEAGIAPTASLAWGLGRSVALESATAWGGLVDLAPGLSDLGDTDVAAVIDSLARGPGEDQLAWRDGRTFVPRLVPMALPAPGRLPLDAGASVLVTGGLGGLGPRIARWLADEGARHIVLAGRRGLPSGDEGAAVEAALAPLRARGVEFVVERADVADAAAMRRLFERLDAEGRPVRGIVHAAAAIRFQALQTLAASDLDAALRAKVQGTWVLHELTRERTPAQDAARSLQFMVLFSSATTLFGAKGLAAYAMANQFLGALARHRRALGLPATCIDWGAWSEIRLLGRDGQEDIRRLGYRPMQDAEAFARASALVAAGVPACMVADVDWATATSAYESSGRRPFLEEMRRLGGGSHDWATRSGSEAAAASTQPAATPAATDTGADAPPPPDLRETLQALAPRARRERLGQTVRGALARVLGLPDAQAVDPGRGFFELGLDSLMSMQFRRRLGDLTGLELPATVTFNHPSVWPLVDHLLHELGLASDGPGALVDPAGGEAERPSAAPTRVPAAAEARPGAPAPARDVEAMSDDDVRRALQAELAAAGLDAEDGDVPSRSSGTDR